MSLEKLTPVGRRAAGGCERRRFERFAEVGEDLADRARLRDGGDEPDVAAACRTQERNFSPTRAISLAHAKDSPANGTSTATLDLMSGS